MFVPSMTIASPDEGLDFGCHLLTDAISDQGNASSDNAVKLLQMLSSFIQFPYVGETGLALDELIAIGVICSDSEFTFMDKDTSNLFWAQITWIASKVSLSKESSKTLSLFGEQFT